MPDQVPSTRLAHAVHLALLIGVCASGGALAVGLVVALMLGRHAPEAPPPAWATILAAALQAEPLSLLYLGLGILMLTPLARVLVLAIGWLVERRFGYAAIALVVLALLIVSLMLGAP